MTSAAPPPSSAARGGAGDATAPGAALRMLGVAGSLRRRSLNRALLRAVAAALPDGVAFDELDLTPVPLYNGDLDGAAAPAAVTELRRAIAAADGVVLACPEYNWGPSGVLKNAIDWASRPKGQSVLRGKPIGLVGVARGRVGTARAQLALRTTLHATRSRVLPHPNVELGFGPALFDERLRLVDPDALAVVDAFARELVRWMLAVGLPAEVR